MFGVRNAQCGLPIYLHVETDTGNDTLMVGVPGSIIFRADSAEGWRAAGFLWPIVYHFTNGNIIGPLSEGSEVFYSAYAYTVFESLDWHPGYGASVTDPDTTVASFIDFGGLYWNQSEEMWRITFVPSDTGHIVVDSVRTLLYSLHVVDEFGNVPFTWKGATITVVPYCPVQVAGDVNADGRLSAPDIIVTVNYIFKGGATPAPYRPR